MWHGSGEVLTPARIAAAVAARSPMHAPPPHDARLSAVLVALRDGSRGAEVLLTRRSVHVRSHQGEMSFPGGRVEPGETFRDAALREAAEEVALPPASVEVVGSLDSLTAQITRSYIVPIVGVVHGDPPLRALESEVELIMWVPLGDLVREGVHREEVWGGTFEERTIHFFELTDDTVWGATARMLDQLLDVVHSPPV